MLELFGRLLNRLWTLAVATLLLWVLAAPVAGWLGCPAPPIGVSWCVVVMLETAGFVLRGKTLISEREK